MPALADLLEQQQGVLRALLAREAGGLFRFESLEDLAQGVSLRVLAETDRFEYRSDAEFVAWLKTLARRHVADRADYWLALRRGSGRVMRLTWGGSEGGDPLAALPPSITRTGPPTFASRRELLVLAAQAMGALPERDRDFVRWMSESVSIQEQAERLGISYEAAQRGGLRAVERFKKAYRLVAQGPAR